MTARRLGLFHFGVCMEAPLRWQESYEQLRAAPDERQLFARIAEFAKKLGFEYCCYGIRVPLPVSNPAVAIFDTYPAGWMKHYQESRFIEIDPTVRQGMSSSKLIVWPDASGASNASRLWGEAYDFGLRVGIAQSSWAAHGVYGLLTMARHADPLTSAEIDDLTLQASWLTNLSHALMSEFLVPRLAPEASVVLTPRESEVLCWTGEGKTACEIGQILSISERTVNFHVNNVLLKLNATNKVQAVVKAVAMGLISSY
jgi:LuxR family transcriptional regulator, quorum-sensing system regulator SolR